MWSKKEVLFACKASLAAFVTYLCMYAYRKPFTSAEFDGIRFIGIDYKILLILSQLIGYTLSKYIGIKYISELKQENRTKTLVQLMSFALLMLFFFAITPPPYNFIFMFFNGIPLGMIWGVVFGYIEGRRSTEMLGAIMASSFIISSGLVKGVGKLLLDSYGIHESWMPVCTALLFTPALLLGIWMLHTLQAPSESDIQERTERIPMKSTERKAFIQKFSLGITLVIVMYVALTIFRDVRDNFAVDFWKEIYSGNISQLLVTSEIPIAVVVLVVISCMIFIKKNKTVFFTNLFLISLSGIVMFSCGILFLQSSVTPFMWMILSGGAMYLPYLIFHTVLYERWIAY
ncbi:MAG: hypothetical protein RL335_487, partial [Bacteroidota bacterium]